MKAKKYRDTETEAHIQKDILDYLQLMGHYAFRVSVGGVPLWKDGKFGGFRKAATKGISDILCCSKTGQFVAIEVKRWGGVTTNDQDAFLAEVIAHGGIAIVARSVQDVMDKGL